MSKFNACCSKPEDLAVCGLMMELSIESSYVHKIWQHFSDASLVMHELSLTTDEPATWWIDAADQIDAAFTLVEQGIGG